MSIITSPLLLGADSGIYQISRSLRFNSGDSAYLNRTPASAGNRTNWTWSAWVKRSNLSSDRVTLFGGYGAGNETDWFEFGFDNDTFYWTTYSFTAASTAVFRDVSAWYHILVSYNGSNIVVYVNNSVVLTSAKTGNLGVNGAWTHTIGKGPSANIRYFPGYLADIHFIDGQALTPSSFTETNATTGQLIPKAYTGSYGTNGFKLNFSDNSTTAALGTDSSGAGNSWSVNNFSVTAGGSTLVTVPSSGGPTAVDYLVVAGGGGGGPGQASAGGGGGGAGGLLQGSAFSVAAGSSYSVSVGEGGAIFNNGQSSSFSSIVATGGGRGGQYTVGNPSSGGSGGGGQGDLALISGASGTSGQGNAGGNGSNSGGFGGGGGGGSSSSGANASGGTGGAGGSGTILSITGSSVTYAAGARGGDQGSGSIGGGNGTPNTGNGGGGGVNSSPVIPAGTGGSGIVVLRYSNTFADLSIGGGLTYSYANTGGYKIYTFTASTTPAQAAGNDSLVDTPTSISASDTGIGGQIVGNYCTLNPLDQAGITFSNGNLDTTGTGICKATFGLASGKWYWEQTVITKSDGANNPRGGVATASASLTNDLGAAATQWVMFMAGGSNGGKGYNASTITGSGSAFAANDVAMFAYDADAGKLWFGRNGTWITGDPAAGTTPFYSSVTAPVFPVLQEGSSSSISNYGARAFSYTAPSGFKALVDTNLPTPVVAKPDQVFQTVLYTGNGSARSITGLDFSPDFVWIKARSAATQHNLYDVVRGATKELYSDFTDAEGTAVHGLTAFNSNGFSLGSLSVVNGNGNSYVSWNWDAGTSTVTNTAGSITSQVRANASAGFSVVSVPGYTYPTKTAGHGLGVEPHFIITKNRGVSNPWVIYHKSAGANTYFQFDTGAGYTGVAGVWSGVTSTVFPLNSGVNQQTDIVAYCFAPVSGYSSAFSYTGNGDSSGPFVYLGFRPRFIIQKRTDSAGSWLMIDTARDPVNVARNELFANSSAAEYDNTSLIDVLSNGFKIRATFANMNASGGSFIGYAFAENPFQYARAR